MNKERIYAAIDLKSFYASVEAVELGYDPLSVRLVVADESRTAKTICLAVSPALKAYGIPGRARLFEVEQRAKECGIDFVIATPRMRLYMDYSTRIYNIYLNYIAPEDIHVYSVDEVFIDLTDYLKIYDATPRELCTRMIREVYAATGITATCGIGTNLYLAKVAMDILAKHAKPDEIGVRLAELDEISYREQLWAHQPLTDFWRVGRGYRKKLEEHGMYTMGDVARCSLGKASDYHNEELLFRLFGVNAELLIDHAWGYEPCTIAAIKAYRPETNSVSQGQVLKEPYPFDKARLVAREMADLLSLDLVQKGLVTDQVVLTVNYDVENCKRPEIMAQYQGPMQEDHYGRIVPKNVHGSENLPRHTASTRQIIEAFTAVFDRIVDPQLLIRRMYVVANHVIPAAKAEAEESYEQLSLFSDPEETESAEAHARDAREAKMQEAILSIKEKYGKNAILRGMNLEEGATMKERNAQVGGHKA